MAAVVTKSFLGVRDGEVHPVNHAPGSLIGGDLAEVAKKEGWAVDENDPAAGSAGGDVDDGKQPGEPVEIQSDWAGLGWPKLRALAAKIKGVVITEIKGAEEARGIVNNEVDRRAAEKAEAAAAAGGEKGGGDDTKSRAGAGDDGGGDANAGGAGGDNKQ